MVSEIKNRRVSEKTESEGGGHEAVWQQGPQVPMLLMVSELDSSRYSNKEVEP